MRNLLMIFILNFICINVGFCQTWNMVYIYTPHNVLIEGAQILSTGELTDPQKADFITYFALDYPYNTFLSEATWTYNCHGYAWYMSSPINGETVWIDSNPYSFWEKEDFVETTKNYATKVFYDNTETEPFLGYHSANTTVNEDIFESKFGQGPLYRHYKDDCPWSGDETIFIYYKACSPVEIQGQDYHTGGTENISGCEIQILNNVKIRSNKTVNFNASYIIITGDFYIENGSSSEMTNN